ncbi:major facilitator superfamily domain-containing protein [Thelonectria olida]|uniref:Major facilitator superfamily domain-containing protein n=1 Tax=Thelonectria olida TaxID=1576542 RepID=A0A9P9ALR1_9HYPO|nr:major facilitator superfamily domain-containing protein [Thelonectria olida]
MATINSMAPQPTAEVPAAVTNEIQKQLSHQENDPEKPELNDEEAQKQDGVKRVEAITTVWTKQVLVVMFILLYLVSFIDQLLQSVQSTLIPYITSAFDQHGLLATTGIVATIIGGVCNLTIAKIIDIWGRVEGFLVMLLLVVIGMIMKATCTNVEMYAAAHTLYWVGHLGLGYVITIILADITSLRNRMILFGINSTPIIATTFAGPRIADLFYTNVNFRWAFGAFLIMQVFFCIPVAVIFLWSKRKAIAAGVYPQRVANRNAWESFKYYFIQFDVIGMMLTVFGWSLLLLPFSLVYYAPNGWKTGYIIAMIVLGVVLLVTFVLYERFLAPVPYIPWKFLKDRTILGACLVYGIMFCSIFTWDAYYSSYLQVVHNLDITISGYVLNSFSLMSSFIGPFVGLAIRYIGTFKWPSIAMTPFAIMGTALLIHFRTPESGVNWLVMCQLFNGIYSGVWALTAQLAIMASVTHQEIAVSIALFGLFGSIGAAMGFAIAGGLWTNILPQQLLARLPEDSKDQMATIYGDITVQLSYPPGSPVRDAINAAYSDVQRKMVITGVAIMPLCIACLFLWKNINVRKLEKTHGTQTKGTVW